MWWLRAMLPGRWLDRGTLKKLGKRKVIREGGNETPKGKD